MKQSITYSQQNFSFCFSHWFFNLQNQTFSYWLVTLKPHLCFKFLTIHWGNWSSLLPDFLNRKSRWTTWTTQFFFVFCEKDYLLFFDTTRKLDLLWWNLINYDVKLNFSRDIFSRDIHIECSKQFKWNLYFYLSWQSQPFWAVLKLL